MAVILMIGLAMSGVTVALDRFVPSQAIDSQARQVLSEFDLARSGALAAGRDYRLVVDLDKQQYRIYTPYDAEGRIARRKEEQSLLGGQSKVLETGVNFAGVLDPASGDVLREGEVEFVFSPTGIMTDIFLYLSSDASESLNKTLHLGGLTGRTEVLEGHATPGRVRDEDFPD